MKNNELRKKGIGTLLLSLLLFFISIQSSAQFTLRIELVSIPSKHLNDSIYVAGNFNRWQPAETGYLFFKDNDKIIVEMKNLPPDIYQFKFTRGDWKRVEASIDGNDVGNKIVKLTADTIVRYEIAAWKDDFLPVPKEHTASNQVHILDTAFYIPQLNRTRRIWIYLPEDYSKNKKSYPVMYMHDGQNLFDTYTSGFGEWGVDECLDSLIKTGRTACIVVGIDNGPQRFNEYNPYNFQQFGKGEGDQYLDFLVQTLKPFIDRQYRTMPSKENTIIAGSSMGGLISYYAMLQYSGVFGKAGIFSPAFWTAPEIKVATSGLANKLNGKFFFYMGELEGGKYITDMQEVQEILGEKSNAMIYSVIDPESSHNELAWRKWFAEFYKWIMADGFNNVVKTKE
ncbi:MAG: alpha/beta hydrolase-fold protein [Ferruginibacter sp.]